MEFLGIGPSELLFIVIIALIVLGPRDMQKAGRTIGKWMRKVVTSDGWKLFQQTSREIQTLPNRLMREAALEELQEVQKDLKKDLQQSFEVKERPSTPPVQASSAGVQPRDAGAAPGAGTDNQIMPPPAARTDDEDKNA